MKLSFLVCFSLIALAFHTASAQTAYPPAPFVLTPSSTAPNPILYRIDHTGGCMGNRVENDEPLELQWQLSRWQPPFESRNDTTDTVRYELNVLIDSVGATSSKTITVSFPAGWPNQPWHPGVSLAGDQIYEKIFRPPVPWPMEPDTIVMRVNWFVRAYNRTGSTYSDTAGVTVRNAPYIPTYPLVLSYNRPPLAGLILPVTPDHNSVIGNITSATDSINIIWTYTRDRNIDVGIRNAVFRWYVQGTGWENDRNYDHTVDTITSMFVGTVVRTSPPGKGAPIGTVFVKDVGARGGFPLRKSQINQLFGGFSNDTASTSADSVVIDWRVYFKDFNYYGGASQSPMEAVTFRYKDDGTLQSDTAKWSRFGCRPHELVSSSFRFTLARDRTSDIPRFGDGTPSVFTLAQNYPNPFHSSTTFEYTLPTAASVRIVVYDVLGTQVSTLASGRMDAGTHLATWDAVNERGQSLPPGIYICRMLVNGSMQSRVMTLMR
jgi:hypothetical protein